MNEAKFIGDLWKTAVAVAVVFVFVLPGSAIFINDNMSDSRTLFAWHNEIYLYETSGSHDTFEFGESDSATDGLDFPPFDIEHAPFPPPYFAIYSIVESTKLAKDTRLGPGDNKTWDIDAQWISSSSDPTDITISWEPNGFDGCEYNSIVLMRYDPFDEEWDFAADMLTEEEYVYSPRYFASDWLIDHFQITAALDTTSLQITDVTLTASDPLDTDIGWENFSCTVTDNTGVDEVKLAIVGDITTEYPMTKDGDDYYCNITISTADEYTYHIWANDTSDNYAVSASDTFDLPLNEDVNMDGEVHFLDLVAVSLTYNDEGPPGWIREDVDNNGKVHFIDMVAISMHYNEEW